MERVVGEDDAVLRRGLRVRAALRAHADDARHVDPAIFFGGWGNPTVSLVFSSAVAPRSTVPLGGGGAVGGHSRRFAEEVVAGEVVLVQDPEDELVLRVGRGGVDVELEHLVPARVPPLVSGDAALALLATVLHEHVGVQLPCRSTPSNIIYIRSGHPHKIDKNETKQPDPEQARTQLPKKSLPERPFASTMCTSRTPFPIFSFGLLRSVPGYQLKPGVSASFLSRSIGELGGARGGRCVLDSSSPPSSRR